MSPVLESQAVRYRFTLQYSSHEVDLQEELSATMQARKKTGWDLSGFWTLARPGYREVG